MSIFALLLSNPVADLADPAQVAVDAAFAGAWGPLAGAVLFALVGVARAIKRRTLVDSQWSIAVGSALTLVASVSALVANGMDFLPALQAGAGLAFGFGAGGAVPSRQ